MEYVVYVKTDSVGFITAVVSSAFLTDTTGWVEIDRGCGDRYALARANYFQDTLMTDDGAYRYKLLDGEPVECTEQEIAEQEEALKPIPSEEHSVEDVLNALLGVTE